MVQKIYLNTVAREMEMPEGFTLDSNSSYENQGFEPQQSLSDGSGRIVNFERHSPPAKNVQGAIPIRGRERVHTVIQMPPEEVQESSDRTVHLHMGRRFSVPQIDGPRRNGLIPASSSLDRLIARELIETIRNRPNEPIYEDITCFDKIIIAIIIAGIVAIYALVILIGVRQM